MERPNIYQPRSETIRATQSYCPTKKRSIGIFYKNGKNVPKDVNSIYHVELHSENINSEDLENRIKVNAALNNEDCVIKNCRKDIIIENSPYDAPPNDVKENGFNSEPEWRKSDSEMRNEHVTTVNKVNKKLDNLELSGSKKTTYENWRERPKTKEEYSNWRADKREFEEEFVPIGLSPPTESLLMQRRLKPLSSVDKIIVGVYST